MNNARAFKLALERCMKPSDKLIVLHSSFAHLNPPKEFSKWDVLHVLREIVKHGVTVVIPTYTFASCGGTEFDPKTTPSNVGILGNWVSDLPEFHRSNHPIYSHQIAGPLAGRLLNAKNSTTFGNDSIFTKFEKLNARFIMLGCDWQYCTYFHKFEEEALVPYREYKIFPCKMILENKRQTLPVKMFVRNSIINAENDFSLVVHKMQKLGLITNEPLWRGKISSATAVDLALTTREILQNNPYGLVADKERVKFQHSIADQKKKNLPYNIALLGHSNLSIIESVFRQNLEKELDRELNLVTVPFGQMAYEIIQQKSTLNKVRLDLSLFIDRLEDIAGVQYIHEVNQKILSASLEQYIESLYEFRRKSDSSMIILSFPKLSNGVMDHNVLDNIINSSNRLLKDAVSQIPDAHLIDISPEIADCKKVSDNRLWSIGRYPYTKDFSNLLSQRLIGLTLAVSGQTAKLIAIDLDNTLWGGILGDDGAAALAIGGDYPGNTFKTFQTTLKRLTERGIALAILSKNDEDLALKTIDRLPNMVLTSQDFVAHRINWLPKADNLKAICAELNLSEKHVLFVDDNPTEREYMRQALPAVKVLDLPQDTAEYTRALINCPWITTLAVTDEDKMRIKAYKSRKKILKDKKLFSDNKNFFKSLESQLFFERLNDGNSQRAHQLINKTNQYNVTTKRYSLTNLNKIEAQGDWVVVIGAQDKFTSRENIGVLIVNWNTTDKQSATIDSYLLSCRFLGRGLETAPIHWLAQIAKNKNYKFVTGQIIETISNEPARKIFQQTKFKKAQGGKWHLDLSNYMPSIPEWLKITDYISKERV